MTVEGHRRGFAGPGGALLLGLVAGALGGLLLLFFGAILVALAVLALAIGMATRPRPFGLSGTLIGWGGCWLMFFARAQANCAAANARANEGCIAPDPLPFVGFDGVLILFGLILLGLGVRHARGGSVERISIPIASVASGEWDGLGHVARLVAGFATTLATLWLGSGGLALFVLLGVLVGWSTIRTARLDQLGRFLLGLGLGGTVVANQVAAAGSTTPTIELVAVAAIVAAAVLIAGRPPSL